MVFASRCAFWTRSLSDGGSGVYWIGMKPFEGVFVAGCAFCASKTSVAFCASGSMLVPLARGAFGNAVADVDEVLIRGSLVGVVCPCDGVLRGRGLVRGVDRGEFLLG